MRSGKRENYLDLCMFPIFQHATTHEEKHRAEFKIKYEKPKPMKRTDLIESPPLLKL